jgi:hypothetical protein
MGKKSKHRKKQEALHQLQLRSQQREQQQTTVKLEEKQMSNGTTTVVGNTEVKVLKSVGVVMSCVLSHKVVSTSHKLTWNGKKLNPIWPEVLAFFKWTYDTTRSESQVRLFVNRNTGEWLAWAFPQKAKMNMNAHEITEGEEGYDKTQRAKFNDEDGWQYWGTVHHHCSMQAFQSGTDTANEKNQDGIHITVGHMDRNIYDIDFRLYIGGIRLDGTSLTEFWDVGDAINALPAYAKALLKDGAIEQIAKWSMGQPAKADQTFPEIWKENVIDCTPKAVVYQGSGPVTHGQYQPSFTPHWAQVNWRSILTRSSGDYDIDRKKAHCEIKQMMVHPQCEYDDMKELLFAMEHLSNMLTDGELEILDICMRNDLTPDKLAKYLIKELVDEQARMKAWEADKIERANQLTNGTTTGKKKGKTIDAQSIQEEAEERERKLREAMHEGWNHQYGTGD